MKRATIERETGRESASVRLGLEHRFESEGEGLRQRILLTLTRFNFAGERLRSNTEFSIDIKMKSGEPVSSGSQWTRLELLSG